MLLRPNIRWMVKSYLAESWQLCLLRKIGRSLQKWELGNVLGKLFYVYCCHLTYERAVFNHRISNVNYVRGRSYDRRGSSIRYSRSPSRGRSYRRSPSYYSPSPRRDHYSRYVYICHLVEVAKWPGWITSKIGNRVILVDMKDFDTLSIFGNQLGCWIRLPKSCYINGNIIFSIILCRMFINEKGDFQSI